MIRTIKNNHRKKQLQHDLQVKQVNELGNIKARMRAYTKMVAFVAFLERKESTKKTTESIIQCTKKRLYNLAHGQKNMPENIIVHTTKCLKIAIKTRIHCERKHNKKSEISAATKVHKRNGREEKKLKYNR